MKGIPILSGILTLLCATMVWRVCVQRHDITTLRAQAKQLLAALPGADETGPAAVSASPTTSRESSSGAAAASSELLRLRNQVNQLTKRQRELGGERKENAQLKAQLVSRTNSPAGAALPQGYIRKSQARMVGYSSPANTLESLLWAIQSKNLESIMQAFTPENAARITDELKRSGKSEAEFFQKADELPGLNILRQESLPDGTIALEVEIVPGLDAHKFVLRQVAGEWKIAGAGP